MENENKNEKNVFFEKKKEIEKLKEEERKEGESLIERSRREKWEEKRRKRQEKRENRKERKKRRKLPMILAASFLVLLFVIAFSFLYKRYSPSNKVMPLSKYFHVKGNEVALMVHDKYLEDTGFVEENQIYIPYEVVQQYINKRFYFDSTENILSYTTAYEVIRSEVGSGNYQVNKSKSQKQYEIVKTKGEKAYIALDFVKEYSNVTYKLYKNPNRLMIESGWGNTYSYYKVKKSTKLRYRAGIKCDILKKLEESDVLRVVNDGSEELKSYAKVMTKDGVTGYVLKKHLSDVYEETMTNDYKEETYPHITKSKEISMAWHQVTNMSANAGLLNTISSTKGLNVISPTWFAISSNKGEISSLASEDYVQKAHNNGLEVWALCNDFEAKSGTVDLATVLGNTSNRDKLVNRLVASAIEYNLDGINIDFEYITKKTAAAYLEFLRELSVKCRANGIVLSVDSYVPSSYTTYYDREEQGKVVDYVVVMAYDEHYAGSEESGSVASIGYVKDAVEQITESVNPSQVIIGIPFYTRLWREYDENGAKKISSSALSMSQAEETVKRNGATAKWDETTAQNYAEFKADNSVYKIWLEDEKSIEEKLKVIFSDQNNGKIAGISCWKLGMEKKNIWNTLMKYTN